MDPNGCQLWEMRCVGDRRCQSGTFHLQSHFISCTEVPKPIPVSPVCSEFPAPSPIPSVVPTSRLPREGGDSPSLEMFQTHLDAFLCHLPQVALPGQWAWTGGCPQVPSNADNSRIQLRIPLGTRSTARPSPCCGCRCPGAFRAGPARSSCSPQSPSIPRHGERGSCSPGMSLALFIPAPAASPCEPLCAASHRTPLVLPLPPEGLSQPRRSQGGFYFPLRAELLDLCQPQAPPWFLME